MDLGRRRRNLCRLLQPGNCASRFVVREQHPAQAGERNSIFLFALSLPFNGRPIRCLGNLGPGQTLVGQTNQGFRRDGPRRKLQRVLKRLDCLFVVLGREANVTECLPRCRIAIVPFDRAKQPFFRSGRSGIAAQSSAKMRRSNADKSLTPMLSCTPPLKHVADAGDRG
jgi:hypothetical protein